MKRRPWPKRSQKALCGKSLVNRPSIKSSRLAGAISKMMCSPERERFCRITALAYRSVRYNCCQLSHLHLSAQHSWTLLTQAQDAERTVEDATRFSNEIIPRARGDAERILQDAEAYRDKVIADSTGEAARFEQILEEYRQAPRVTRERMYLETMETVLGNAEKLVLDSESGAVPYLPIDRVQRGDN